MSFNPNDFFVLRPLRWAFGQLFGSKAKVYFDALIAPQIQGAINKSGNLNVNNFLKSNLDSFVNGMVGALGIPEKYRFAVKEFIIAQVKIKF